MADLVAADDDPSEIRVCLVRFDFVDDRGVCYVLALDLQDTVVVNDVEGVSPINPFAVALRTYTIPWRKRPILLEYEMDQMDARRGCLQSWRYVRYSPVL